MADEIIQNFQHKYESIFHHLLQQKENRLRQFVTVKSNCAGKLEHFDRYGILGFTQKTARQIGNAQHTNVDAPTSKRVMAPLYFDSAVGFDEFDASQLAAADVPLTETTQSLGFAAARKMEDIIISGDGSGNWGMTGNAFDGETGAAGAPIALPAGQTVGDGTGPMSMAKLRGGLQLMMENEAWGQDSESNGDVCCIALRAKQIAELLGDLELTTTDQRELRNLLSGGAGFADIYGIRIIRTEQVADDGTSINSPMWVKSKVLFGLWVDHRVKLSIRDDAYEAIQLRAKFGCGSTRLEEEGVCLVPSALA